MSEKVDIDLRQGDCQEVMKDLPDNSVDLIVTDPPYFKVKNEAWDNQWNKPHHFLDWIRTNAEQWRRILKPNGSLYCFASPQMAAHVEVVISDVFNVLTSITWVKPDPLCDLNKGGGLSGRCCKETLRSWFPRTEEIIFAEHYGADNIAKGEAGYGAKCDKLRGFVFEPLRAYLVGERDRSEWTTQSVDNEWQRQRGTLGCMAGHWFGQSQWTLPTEENYNWLRKLFNVNGTAYLRREYEDLRREYEDLRRPFSVTADVPYTDVWSFPTVQAYYGKHPCEKPLALMEHIINASSRPGGIVLDPFLGSGTTGVACIKTGRNFIGIEKDEAYFNIAKKRIETELNRPRQLTLF